MAFLKVSGRPFAHVILIAVLGLLAYSNTFNVPFQFDDIPNIVENPIIKDLAYYSDTGSARPFQGYAEYPSLRRRYIGSLSFALNYRFHGLRVAGYHAVNLAVHIGCALLVYALVILLVRSPSMQGCVPEGHERWAALMAGTLFVLHPVQTQAVTYIVQRFASLTALFYLGAVVLYAASRQAKGAASRWIFYAFGLVSAVLAMKTKATAFTLPLNMLLFEALLFKGKWRSRAWTLVPYLATIVIIPATMLITHEQSFAAALTEGTQIKDIPRLKYLATEARVLLTYLRLLALPVGQNLDYDYPLAGALLSPAVMLCALAHVAVLAGSLLLLRRRDVYRMAGLGVIWFYLTISVESTLITLEPIFEHRLYLPSAGLFVAAATLAVTFYSRLNRQGTRTAVMVFFVAAPLILGALTVHRNTVWQSEIALWEDTAGKSPKKARPLYTLGMHYQHSGRLREAIDLYRQAIVSEPGSYEARVNYAVALWEAGSRKQAVQELERSLMIVQSAEGYYNLAVSYFRMQVYASAAENFRQAIGLHKNFPEAYIGLAESYMALGEPAGALNAAREGLAIAPVEARLYLVIGRAQLAMGKRNEAIRTYEDLVSVDPERAGELLELLQQGR